MTVRNLDSLMAPRSVALIGASPRPGSVGRAVMERLLAGGFDGPIGLVNPAHAEIDGRPCVASVAALATPPDLGVIATPPAAVPGAVAALGAAGARAAVVITAGVDAESGLRQAMLDAARPHMLRVLGPNSIGLQVPHHRLDASFAHLAAAPGDLALVSQSGAIASAMLDWAAARRIGFSLVASVGDMADVDTGDMLDFLAADRHTRAILLYLEQVTHPRKFMSAARSAARVKPVIAVKAGRSDAAARAALLHSGAAAGQDAVCDAALRRAGVLRVEALEDLFGAAEALSGQAPLANDRLAILTNGGGAGVLAMDALAHEGGRLADLSEATLARIDAVAPKIWSGANPVDVIGDADADRYVAALEALLDDPGVDAVLALFCPTARAAALPVAERVVAVRAARRARGGRAKPILTNWLGEATAGPARKLFSAAAMPVYFTPGQAVAGFAHMAEHAKAQAALMRVPPSLPADFSVDHVAARAVLQAALADGRDALTEPEAKRVLRAYGVPAVATEIAVDPEEAGRIALRMLADGAQRLVAKILSRDIARKSEIGGVRLNLATAGEAAAAAAAMIAAVRRARPEARIDGVTIQPMIRRGAAQELIAGMTEDPVFGPVMLVGAGGVAADLVADRALGLPPLDLRLAADMLAQTRVSRLMAGGPLGPAADRDAVAMALVRLSYLAADFPQITGIEVNPLLADAEGVVALDARITIAPAADAGRGGNPRFALRPYPAQWDREEVTPRGERLRIRPVRPDDERFYDAFIAGLTAEDRRHRFMSAIKSLPKAEVARLTQLDYDRAMAFVALDVAETEMLGVSRLASDPDRRAAEFAVAVRSDQQGKGLGGTLMRRLIEYAKAEGLESLYGYVAGDNDGMAAMCAKLGFDTRRDPDDPEQKLMTLPLR